MIYASILWIPIGIEVTHSILNYHLLILRFVAANLIIILISEIQFSDFWFYNFLRLPILILNWPNLTQFSGSHFETLISQFQSQFSDFRFPISTRLLKFPDFNLIHFQLFSLFPISTNSRFLITFWFSHFRFSSHFPIFDL